MHSLRRVFSAVALVLVLMPLVASAPLFDPDEGLHAAIAQEMVQRGDYVTPRFLGEPFLDKPILFFWAEAASLRVFGDTETAIRIPPLIFGLAGLLTVALLARTLFGSNAGLVSGIVYATMLLPFGVSQVAVHDIGLVPFMCIAAWCLAAIARADTPPPMQRVIALGALGGVCLGLSILTKGLVGVVFAGIFGACLALWRPAVLVRLAIALIVATVVAALVASPWYIAMERAHPGYLHYYFVERHLQGYLTATQRHAGRPFWYYLPIVLGGALPWTLYLGGAVRSTFTRATVDRSGREQGLRLVVWAWFAIGLVFLSAGESKLLTYSLPLFPSLAILAGEHLSGRGRPSAVLVWLQTLILAVIPAAATVAFQLRYDPLPWFVWLTIGVIAALTIDAGRRARASTESAGTVRWLAHASVYSLAATMLLVPRMASWMTSKDLAAAVNAGGTLPPRVSVLDERIGSFVFYLNPKLRAEATRERLDEATFAEAIGRARHDPEDAILAVRNEYLGRFNRLFPAPPAPDIRAGTFSVFRAITLRQALQNGGMLKPPRLQ